MLPLPAPTPTVDVAGGSGLSHVSSQSFVDVASGVPAAQFHAAANFFDPSPHAHSVGMNA